MQGNGFKIAITAFFLVLSGYYLYPSVQNYLLQRRMQSMEEDARLDYERDNFAQISSVEERALKLGLDLLGGMHVTLEVNVDALIRSLATDPDATFDEVLRTASAEAASDDVPIIDAFVDAFEERDANARLSRYFRDSDAGITRRSTNDEVAAYLGSEADDAVVRAIEIIRQRVDRYGVTEPSIQRQGTRRIVVELPGVDDEERVRNLLRGTARLEFRLMAEPDALRRSLQQIIEHYEDGDALAGTDVAALPSVDSLAAEADSAALDSLEAPELDTDQPVLTQADTTDADAEADTSFDVGSLLDEGGETASVIEGQDAQSTNPLLDVLIPAGQGTEFGYVASQDTAEVNQLLREPEVQEMLPNGDYADVRGAAESADRERGRSLHTPGCSQRRRTHRRSHHGLFGRLRSAQPAARQHDDERRGRADVGTPDRGQRQQAGRGRPR